MIVCMRTTINLPDGLAEAAKVQARREGRTFTSLVEDGLRHVLSDDDATVPVSLPAYGDPAARPLIDLSDTEAVWAVLDADSPR